MNEQGRVIEREINLIDFLWSMLEQWRGWLILGLIFALLLPMGKYEVDTRRSIKQQEQVASQTMGQQDSSIDLINAAQYYYIWKEWSEYYDKSKIMTIDPMNVDKLFLTYYLEDGSDGVDLKSISTVYFGLINDPVFLNDLSLIIGPDMDQAKTAELIDNTADMKQDGETGSFVFTISIILLEGANVDSITKCVNDYYERLNIELSSLLGEHTIYLIGSNVVSVYDDSLLNKQKTVTQTVIDYSKAYTSTYDLLSDSDKERMDKAIEDNNVDEFIKMKERGNLDVNINLEDDSSIDTNYGSRVEIDKRYIVLGFVLGVLLYFGIAFFLVVFSRKMEREEEASTLLKLRSFGCKYDYPYNKGIKRFLHDRNIYNWRHRMSSTLERIAEGIRAKAINENITEITCIVIGNCAVGVRASITEIGKKASGDILRMSIVDAPDGLGSLKEEEIIGFRAVILTIIGGVTTYAQAMEIITRLKEYDIPVLGMQFFEG